MIIFIRARATITNNEPMEFVVLSASTKRYITCVDEVIFGGWGDGGGGVADGAYDDDDAPLGY